MQLLLTLRERERIEYYRRLRLGLRQIGRRLGRDHAVIQRELRRNASPDGRYRALRAQQQADERATHTNKKKLDTNERLAHTVARQLRLGWSPEQIAGRLRSHPDARMHVSYETIYRWIYEGEGRWKRLYACLRKAHQKRYRKKGRKPKKTHIPERISIHERLAVINERQRIGDWETDTLQFSRQRAGLSVQYERRSMLARLHKVENRSAEETEMAIRHSVESLPASLWKSITFDNGGEGACHVRLRRTYALDTYFCDPYASWQKGGVENLNGLIRQYLPRTTTLATITEDTIRAIQERLNNRPRKKLHWKTPNEMINEQSGALNS